MEGAQNYGRFKTSAIIGYLSHMTTAPSHSFTPKEKLPAATKANWQSILLEPLLCVGASLFWLAVLPIAGLFCVSIAIYDKAGSLRRPGLRCNAAQNPLVLRTKGERKQPIACHRSTASRAFQS